MPKNDQWKQFYTFSFFVWCFIASAIMGTILMVVLYLSLDIESPRVWQVGLIMFFYVWAWELLIFLKRKHDFKKGD